VVGEGVTSEGEQYVVAPSGIVCGGEVQCDRDERTDVLHASGLDMDVGDDGSLIVIVRRSRATDGGGGRGRGFDQGYCGASLLGEDGSRALLLLQERGGGEDLSTGGIVPFLCVGGGDDYGIEFLLKLGSLGSLAVIVSVHQRWWRRRREGDRPLGFERSGSKKNLGFDYHVGERRAAEYWMHCIECIGTYL
jgi:hypothetical protein